MTLQTFHFEGTPVRDVLIDGQPWFVGKDACAILEIANHNDALSSLPDDERKGVGIADPLGRNEQQMICVNEPGLYRLIFKSRKPEAERFKRWVLHEVLPEIRRTGGYAARHVAADFGADGTVPVAAYVTLLLERLAELEERAKPKKKRAARPPLSAEEIQTIRQLATEGLSGNEIARRVGRSDAAISGVLRNIRTEEAGL